MPSQQQLNKKTTTNNLLFNDIKKLIKVNKNLENGNIALNEKIDKLGIKLDKVEIKLDKIIFLSEMQNNKNIYIILFIFFSLL